MSYQSVFSLLLVAAGLGFLGAAGWWDAAEPGFEPTPIDLAVSEPFNRDLLKISDLSSHPADSDFAEEDLLALFVLTPQVCPTVFNDVDEFAQLLSQKDFDPRIRPVVLLLGEKSERVRLLARALDLPWTVAYGSSNELREAVENYEGTPSLQQLVVVDRQREEIFYRALLSSSGTELDYKQQALLRMRDAYKRMRGGSR